MLISEGKQGRWLKLREVQAIVGASVTTGNLNSMLIFNSTLSCALDVVLLGTKDGVGHYALAVQDGAPFTTAQENVEFSDLRRNIALLSTSEAAIIGQVTCMACRFPVVTLNIIMLTGKSLGGVACYSYLLRSLWD